MRVGYWLIPDDESKGVLAKQIEEYAQRFGSPVFEPHLTCYVADAQELGEQQEILDQVSRQIDPFMLSATTTQCTDLFHKTFFINFALTPELEELSALFQKISGSSLEYDLQPHVSLIYADISEEQKQQLKAEYELSLTQVRFDGICAMGAEGHTRSAKDVEDWITIARSQIG